MPPSEWPGTGQEQVLSRTSGWGGGGKAVAGRAHMPSQPCSQALSPVLSLWPQAPSPLKVSAELQPTPTHTHTPEGLNPAPHKRPSTRLLTPRGRHLPHPPPRQPWSRSKPACGGGTTGCFLPQAVVGDHRTGRTSCNPHTGSRQACGGPGFPTAGPVLGVTPQEGKVRQGLWNRAKATSDSSPPRHAQMEYSAHNPCECPPGWRGS